MQYVDSKKLFYQQFLARENKTRHHRYDEELRLYNAIKEGDLDAIDENCKLFMSSLVGHLSHDKIRDKKYLFVASITLATRFAIEGGLDEEVAYTTSDLYIQKIDLCKSVEEIVALNKDMITCFTKHMANIKKKSYSRTVLQCMDYIYNHLHEVISVPVLAAQVKMNPNYLSSLFKKETGQTISSYINSKRMEAAKNMLLYSDISYAEIASILAFSSQSYFTKVFHRVYNMTPREFRKRSPYQGLDGAHAFYSSANHTN